jgi:hypothetical protein
MADEDVIVEILKGRDPAERPADVVMLCTSMALIMFGNRIAGMGPDIATNPQQGSRFLAQLLNLSGKILCPILDFVKPEKYVIEMRNARLEYQGVADDPDLFAAYLHIVRKLEAEKQLESLEQAVKYEVWRSLRR